MEDDKIPVTKNVRPQKIPFAPYIPYDYPSYSTRGGFDDEGIRKPKGNSGENSNQEQPSPSILDEINRQANIITVLDSSDEEMASKQKDDEEIGSDVEIISINEDEYKNSFDVDVRIGTKYQVENLPRRK